MAYGPNLTHWLFLYGLQAKHVAKLSKVFYILNGWGGSKEEDFMTHENDSNFSVHK